MRGFCQESQLYCGNSRGFARKIAQAYWQPCHSRLKKQPGHTSVHKRGQGGGEEGAKAEAGEVVAAGGGERGGAAHEDGHGRDVREAAQRVTHDHDRAWIGYLTTRDYLGQMVVGEDFSEYHALA